MMWLEMARDKTHGGGSWSFSLSLWSPTRKQGGARWPFWESVRQVKSGDVILHLRGIGDRAAFVGYSTADTDGYEISEGPPVRGQWDGYDKFYRVLLRDYLQFSQSISLLSVFGREDATLRNYYQRNHSKHTSEKKKLFYVIQAEQLQCLQGAYLSEVDDELAELLLGSDYSRGDGVQRPLMSGIQTSEQLRELRVRVGQQAFSGQVRSNYEYRCCFPECPVEEAAFLVSAHIARWSDEPELRGDLSNGICLCLMHDKAFETGLFTLSNDFKVSVNQTSPAFANSNWASLNLLPYDGRYIRPGQVLPSIEALRHHWQRVGYSPPG
jgi:putative restriction endonuclease